MISSCSEQTLLGSPMVIFGLSLEAIQVRRSGTGCAVTIRSASKSVGSSTNPIEAADEQLLVARIARGDGEAFRIIVERYLAQLTSIGRRMLRDDAEAEDVAQEALVRLWKGAKGLEIGPAGLRPWLRRVVSNLCIDRIRANRNTTTVDVVPDRAEAATQLRGLDEQALAARVDRALKQLPDRQRLALTLFHYEGLSQNEVGVMLSISDEAVESLLARARRTMKAVLSTEWKQLLPDDDETN